MLSHSSESYYDDQASPIMIWESQILSLASHYHQNQLMGVSLVRQYNEEDLFLMGNAKYKRAQYCWNELALKMYKMQRYFVSNFFFWGGRVWGTHAEVIPPHWYLAQKMSFLLGYFEDQKSILSLYKIIISLINNLFECLCDIF